MTGQRYGRLTVIRRAETNYKSGNARWICQCDCGNKTIVGGVALRQGIIKSCGCLNNEIRSVIHKKYNKYEFTTDICIGYTSKGEKFLVDIDKYDLIKNYCWCFNNDGYVVARDIANEHKTVSLHRLVTNCPKNKHVDHINGNKSKYDNRLCNLRICTNTENLRNRGVSILSKTGVKGVVLTENLKYAAHIGVNNKSYHLGTYNTIKEASDAYDRAAIKYFGDFACLNNYQYENNLPKNT